LAPLRNKLVLVVACACVAIGLIAPAGAAAAGTPDLSLDKNAPAQALLGTRQQVQLVAKNPLGQERGYNLTFRDVLPKGVVYVPGSAKVAPQILENQPAVGMTTLIFENLTDLSANSEYVLGYEVEPLTTFFKFTEEHIYTNKAEVFANEKPREKARFNEKGEVIAGSFTGNDTAEATTELTAIEIEKSEPSPEGEILRGVHEHQTVYTLHVRNNKVGPTQGVAGIGPGGKPAILVEDFLPPGLEFLGCGKVDNTTDTTTNEGSDEEYPGSGPIDPDNAPAAPQCKEPFYVKTEKVDPPGPRPEGVYTHVKFAGPEAMATGAEFEIQYIAAIPILQNTVNWLGAEPTAASLGQIANLNNNSGPETFDEEQLTNIAQAHGVYEAVPVQDADEMTRTAEDLAIQKSTDQPEIFDQAPSLWSLRLEASEYRRTEPVSITDQLPNGLCPRGPIDYEGPAGGPITEPKSECEASGTLHPSVKYVKGGPAGKVGTEEAIEYSLAEEETTGGFKLEFNAPDVEALKRLEPSQELLITFPTTTRTFYQSEFKDDPNRPVLTGDSWTNEVKTEGPAFSRCIVPPATPDPNCEGAGAEAIVEEPVTGTEVTDVSSASQQAGGVEIEKTVRENNGPVPTFCKNAPEGEYVKGLVSAEEPTLPQYRPGDVICWRLVVKFASNLYAGAPVVSDFIPPDEEYVQGSQEAGENNTVEEVEFNGKAALEEEALEWKLGKGKAVKESLRFEYLFKTKVKTSPTSRPEEITGNLMKFLYSNSGGETFPLRDRAEVERLEPDLSLEKFITQVGGKSINKVPPGGKSTAVAGGGEKVTYELDLENSGNLDAEEAEVWDELPAEITCADVTLPAQTPPQAATCAEGIIKWTGVSIPEGALTTLTYEVEVPKDVAPGHVFINHTGVTRFKSQTNTTPEKFEYIPAKNINKEIKESESNTGPLLDEAELKTTGATLEKAATTETNQPGNLPNQATIGELIDYTVTANIPANSKVYGTPVIKDVLPSTLKLEGTPSATLDGVTLPTEGLSLNTLANGFEVQFAGAFPTTPSAAEHKVVVSFKARVLNVAANERGKTITNTASFKFEDIEEAGSKVIPESAGTPLVEPNIEVRKKNLLPAGQTTVAPGEVVKYETEVENKIGASTANEVEVVDTVPAGMKVVGTPVPAAIVAGNTITWNLGAIAPGVTEHLHYELEIEKPAKAASSFTNRVKATTQSLPAGQGGEPSQTRTAASGHSGYESKDEDTVKLIGATVSKQVTPTEGTIGQYLTYTLHMNLPPEIKYFNTTMVDRLPNGVTFDELVGIPKCEFEGGESCGTGEEIAHEAQGDGTTLVGWYFGFFEAGKARELTVQFKAHIDDVKVGGGAKVKAPETLTNQLVGLYNETEGTKPTTVPVPKANGFGEETETAEATTQVVEPNVTLAKAVTAVPALVGEVATQPGSKLTYSLTVGNTGTSTAYEVEVKDTNTTGNLRDITPVAGAEFVKSAAGEPLVWVLPKVEVGKPVTLTYTAELASSGELLEDEEVKNAAEVPSYFGLEKTEREASKSPREYVGPKAEKNLEVVLPEIGVVKTTGVEGFPDEATAEVGKEFPWRVVVKNESAVAGAKATTVEDTLPPNWEYVPGSTVFKAVGTAVVPSPGFNPTEAGGESKTLTWANIAELPPTASVEVLFKAVPTVKAIANAGGSQQKNNAVGAFQDLSGASGSEAGSYRAEDGAFAHLVWPELGITKTPDGAETVAGTNDEYVITVANSGTGTAHEVEVKDVLSAGQEFIGPATAEPSTGFAQKSVENDTPGAGETTIVWTIAEVANGTPVNIKVPIKTPPSLNDGDEVTDLATARSPQQTAEPSDPGSFEVHRETNLRILKKAVEPTVNAGEDIHYEVEVENEGPSDATGIVVTDALPENTIFKGSDPECAEAGEIVTCEFAELKVGESHVFKFTVEVKSGTTETIENTASVEDDQEGGPKESTVTTPIGGLANLKIEKFGPAHPVLLGSTFTYEIKVENEGPSDAVNATVVDPLPEQVKFLSATTTFGTCDEAPGGTLTCELERMLPHATGAIVVTVEATEVGKFPNTAVFDSETSPEPKEAEAEAEIVPAADLSITKTAPATVEPDGTLEYSLHVENHGPSVAHKVKVTDPLPAGVDFVSADPGCAPAGTTVTCEVAGELAVGGTADFKVTVHVPFALGGGSLVNTATVAAEEADPHVEDNTSTVTTTVGPAADLAITKTMGKAQAGKPLTYTLAVTNKGPSDSSAVTVKDTLPAGTTFKSAAPSQGTCSASGQTVTCALGGLASGASAQVSITVEVAATATGSLKNTATVEGPEPDPDKSNNEASVEGPVSPADPTDPNLKVVKTADTSTPQVGAPFTYHVTVSNLSGGEAKNVKVVDTLNGPVKVTSIETEAGKCSAAASTITCTIPSIAVGKSVEITYTVVAEAAGQLKNTVSAQAANGEKVPGNNRAVKSVKAKVAQATYTLTKTAKRKVVPGGKTVAFTITLRNGSTAMTDAKICDRLPAALVFVKAAGARYVNGEACWTKKFVAANHAVKLHLTARAVKGYKSRQVRNVATARADNAGRRSASVAVRIKAAFAGKPGGVTG
jgi:fimbrial isopeptide formation D2 family protein/uncharacterized repeat protein (TIGR01451 family)